MWVAQLTVYQLEHCDPTQWESPLAQHEIKTPEQNHWRSIGFAPFNGDGCFVDTAGQHFAFQSVLAERKLPKEAVTREVRIRGLPASGRAHKQAWGEVAREMLAGAPVVERTIPAIFDEDTQRLYVFGTAQAAEEVVLPALREALDTLPATPIVPTNDASDVIKEWLISGAFPDNFVMGHSVELQHADGGKIVLRKKDMADTMIQQHLCDGDRINWIHLIWRDCLEFVLTGRGELRQVSLIECKLSVAQAFSDWPMIMDKLPQLYEEMLQLFGGSLVMPTHLDVDARVYEPRRMIVLAQDDTEHARAQLRFEMGEFTEQRPISSIIAPQVGGKAMGYLYYWAQEAGISEYQVLRASKPPSDCPDDQHQAWMRRNLAEQAFECEPQMLLIYGRVDEAAPFVAKAKECKVPIYRIKIRANRPEMSGS